jgi:hypothetical protein
MSDVASLVTPGLIGLAGALVGALAGYRGSIRGQQLAQKGEADRWRRDRREAAYVELLSVRGQLARIYIQKGDAMQRYTRNRTDDSPSFDFEYWEDQAEPLWTNLDDARARVQIYGSAAARTAVEAWIPGLYTDYGVATRPGGAFGAGIRQTVAEEEARGRDPFITLIKSELGVTDR